MDTQQPTQPATAIAASAVGTPGRLRFRYAPATPHPTAQPLPLGVSAAAYRRYLPLFAPQLTDASCSVATATLVLNALLTARGDKRVTQAWVVGSDATGVWQRATADQSGEGVSLPELAAHLARLLAQKQASRAYHVQTHHVGDVGERACDAFRGLLRRLDGGDPRTFVVINFLQSAVLHDGEEVGHMSVVAAYDRAQDRALVMDVDSTALLPYWVGVGALMAAMNTHDEEGGHKRGYIGVTPLATLS